MVLAAGLVLSVASMAPGPVAAQTRRAAEVAPSAYGGRSGSMTQTGIIEWSLWVDPDGCMHWWADGGLEGYMVPRRDPRTGKPVCLKRNTCLNDPTDALFATGSATLTDAGRDRLRTFFQKQNAFSYEVKGFTDSQGSAAYNLALSKRRAQAVSDVARSVGAVVERQGGYGKASPVASNATAHGMRQNRRVEVVCYRK